MAVGTLWGHDGCDSRWRLKLTSCPRHPGTQLREMAMPKITRYGGATNGGLIERASGFTGPAPVNVPAEWVRPQNQADADLQADAPAVDPERDERVSVQDEDDEQTDEDDSAPEAVTEPPFDPGDYSVKDVVADLPGLSPAERHAVIEAERRGRGRAGILNA